MPIESVVFDLDGTLVKSHMNIYKAMTGALDRLDIPHRIDAGSFEKTIGLHFADIFDAFDVIVPDFEKFIEIYKSIYNDHIGLSEVYPGVPEIIEYLKQNNVKISLLTTKMQDQAEKILKHFNLAADFNFIMGRRPGIAHKPSAEPLLFICGELKIKPQNTLMVGDSEMDIRCGKNAGAKTCAVAYGYRNKNDLAAESPDFMIDNLNEMNYILDEIRK
jgi:phosphoglycolate phosphatase